MWRSALVLAGLLPVACGSDGSFDPDAPDVATDTVVLDDGFDPGESAVCVRWNADRAYLAEGDWTGQVEACMPGAWESPGPENTLRQVNLYRWMADLAPVTLDAGKNTQAQACALMMHANDDIEHDPPASWSCRTDTAVDAAGLSNLATTAGVFGVDLYMIDDRVQNLGHRRWILSGGLGPIGVGSTSDYSCLHVIGGRGTSDARWTAWPPPGDFPIQATTTLSWTTLDNAGWSIQSDAIDLRAGQVTVRVDGESQPIRVETKLGTGYGSTFAIRIRPDGWRSEAGVTYDVSVRNITEDIDYSVQIVDCQP